MKIYLRLVSEWLLFNANWATFQLYHGEKKLHSMKWWWCPLGSRPTRWIFIVLAHWNNSLRVDMSIHSRHIIPILSQPVFALTPECCVLSGEATNTNSIVFGLTRPGLEHTIYCTRGKHANHYTTDDIELDKKN
jgi:hypothetical protein